MAPKTIKNVPENTEQLPAQSQDQVSPMEDVTPTGEGETTQPQQPQDQEPVSHGQPSSSDTITSSVSASSEPQVDEEEKLRQALADASAVRFLQDGATPEVRQSRKRHFTECLEDLKAFQAAKQALRPATEKEVVPRDMPALQLRGGPIRFEDRSIHESISAFFTAFEAQLHSYNLVFDMHWERLFWQCLDNNQRSWFQRCLFGKGYSWSGAQAVIEAEYGNPCHVWLKRQELYDLRQDHDQSIREYVEEFQELSREAARREDDQLCADFICSLLPAVRARLHPVIASTYRTSDPTNLHEVAQLAIRTTGEHMESALGGRHSKKQRTRASNSNNGPHGQASSSNPSRRSRRVYGDCPIHPKGTHSRGECEVLGRIREHQRQQWYVAQGSSSSEPPSSSATSGNDNQCRFCRQVPYSRQHLAECDAYRRFKAARGKGKQVAHRAVHVRYTEPGTSSSTSSSANNNNNMPTTMSRNDAILDAVLPIKLADMDITGNCQHTFHALQDNTCNSLVVAITVQTEQVLALVDTGASRSFITPSLARKINAHINKSAVSDVHVSLAQNGTSATLLGLVANVQLEYDSRFCNHDFLVMDLAGEAPVTIGLDLMPKLHIGITGLTATWKAQPKEKETPINDVPEPNNSPAGSHAQRDAFFSIVQPTIDKNKDIPLDSFCTVPESMIYLDMYDDATVIHKRQYPIPVACLDKVREQVQSWIDDGVVEKAPVSTMWNSPITLAPKKDLFGNYTDKRPCLDPRHINKVLITPDRHPLPLINDIYHELQGSKVFTTLDLKSAFHRFEIYEPHRPKTAFKVPGFPQLMFKGCPFGLKPISSTFQRTMNIIFNDMPFVSTFVDDIIIFSKTIEEHAQHVAAAIEKLTSVNLILNPNKCHFAQKAVYLLGFCVSEQGKSLDARKVTNVQDWPTPQTGKDIMRFLGVINYFREHIPKAADLMAPLDKLRYANRLGKLWGNVEQQAFDNLKTILHQAPILCHPDLNHPFQVATDASNSGIGAVLYQVINGKTHHIGFMARSLSASERNYSTTKRELLAIVFALNKFHKFLWGNHFTLYTDHKALVFLHTQKIANPMMLGWLDTILEYNFNIVHLPGLDNTLPDQLSRLFPTAKELAEGSATQTHSNQHTSYTNHAIEVKGSNTNNTNSGMDDGTDDMFVPPESQRKQLLLEAHAFGLFGAKAMVDYLHSNGLTWDNMHREAQGIVHSCDKCQRYNIGKVGYHPLRPIHAYLPGDHWAIDLAGPFDTSNRGNIYLLVMVDVCTRFCVLHALPDKSSDTVVQVVVHTFCDYGFPRYLQSDNGTEFVNALMRKLTESAGFEHRLVTPYHPRANGLAERFVQTTVNVIRKCVQGAIKDWDLYVKPTQLALNNKVAGRHGSTPFALMFNRAMNGVVFSRSHHHHLSYSA